MNAVSAPIGCASLPAASLPWLASLRVRPGLRVRLLGDRAWIWWPAGDAVVLPRVRSLHGVEVFERREDRWYRPGQHLPVFDVPSDAEAKSLLEFLTPAPVQPEFGSPAFAPLTLRLVRDGRPWPATALCCALDDLAEWAEQTTSKQLAQLTALRTNHLVLLRGQRLPPLPNAPRYWGHTVLIPLGFRPDPEASEAVLREALRLQPDEIALVGPNGFEVIDARHFQPLTRASVRLAVREGR
jgi:hypothetical protein